MIDEMKFDPCTDPAASDCWNSDAETTNLVPKISSIAAPAWVLIGSLIRPLLRTTLKSYIGT